MARVVMSEVDYQAFLERTRKRDVVVPGLPKPARNVKGPNKTELRFVREKLDVWVFEGWFIGFKNEPYRLSVILNNENRVTYRPDFLAWDHEGRVTMFEVKGPRIWDDAKVKFVMAREMFPFWKWEAWQWKGGEWTEIWIER